jgi:hypothetical protein
MLNLLKDIFMENRKQSPHPEWALANKKQSPKSAALAEKTICTK